MTQNKEKLFSTQSVNEKNEIKFLSDFTKQVCLFLRHFVNPFN